MRNKKSVYSNHIFQHAVEQESIVLYLKLPLILTAWLMLVWLTYNAPAKNPVLLFTKLIRSLCINDANIGSQQPAAVV